MEINNYLSNDFMIHILENELELENKVENLDRIQMRTHSYNSKVTFTERLYEDEPFQSWVYSRENCSSKTIEVKMRLMKVIERVKFVNQESYISEIDLIDSKIKTEATEFDIAFKKNIIDLFSRNRSLRIVKCDEDHYSFYVKMLHNTDSIESLIDGSKKLFLNLIIHPNANKTLKTLNIPFYNRKHEIINHLDKLNVEMPKLIPEYLKQGYTILGKEFYNKCGILCSPQSSRKNLSKLEVCYMNVHNKEVKLCCEMHTKFKKYDKENQDRLYFHTGDATVEDGKIIIYYIGDHV